MRTKIPYTEKDLVRIAKRDNNTKRPYLLVNPLQGKHFPAAPSKTLSLLRCLADKLYRRHAGERLLIIGFAETATAIGAAIACHSPEDLFYLQTTRETVPGAEYICFSEAHSHATEQKLAKNHLKEQLSQVDRIVFAEDEVTTGNTISNIVRLLREEYGTHLKFGIASLLNAMPEASLGQFERDGIICTYLVKVTPTDYTPLLEHYTYEERLRKKPSSDGSTLPAVRTISGYINTRIGTSTRHYQESCLQMTRGLLRHVDFSTLAGRRVLVLGTEEFVYPPLLLADCLERECGCAEVTFHATTRSPILPSAEPDYPFFNRYRLRSMYDEARTTYVYNLKPYDQVFVLHDAPQASVAGLSDLYSALQDAGCRDIQILQWRN